MELAEEREQDLFTVADLRRRAAGVLTPPERHPGPANDSPARRGDFDLNPELAQLAGAAHGQPAAVLIPVIEREREASVLFTRRTDHLPTHAGQISFPGGKMENGDASVLETALREAHEEIGLAPEFVDALGFLEDYATASSGYRISPLIAVVRPGYAISPDDSEVAEVFDVPLKFLMDPGNHRIHTRERQGARRAFYAIPYGERFIWGATAGMLRNLYDWLYRTEN